MIKYYTILRVLMHTVEFLRQSYFTRSISMCYFCNLLSCIVLNLRLMHSWERGRPFASVQLHVGFGVLPWCTAHHHLIRPSRRHRRPVGLSAPFFFFLLSPNQPKNGRITCDTAASLPVITIALVLTRKVCELPDRHYARLSLHSSSCLIFP